MREVDTVLSKFDDVHVYVAGVVLAAADEPPVVDFRLRREPIERFGALSRRPVDHDHTVAIDCFPVAVDEDPVFDAGGIANPAAAGYVRDIAAIPLDPAAGEIRTSMRSERIHCRDPVACPAVKQLDLGAYAPNVLDRSGLNVPGRRHPVPAVGKGKWIAGLLVACQIVVHAPTAITVAAQGADY